MAAVHAGGQLVAGNAGGQVVLARAGGEVLLVELLEEVEVAALGCRRDVRRRVEIEDSRLLRPDDRPLIQRRQPAITPVIDAEDRQPRRIAEDDVGRQVLAFASQGISQPRAEDGAAAGGPPRVEGVDRLPVVVDPRVHRADERDVVGHFRQPRHQLGQLHAALAALLELPRAGEQLGAGFRGIVILDVAGEALAAALGQLRLGIEQVEVAGPPLHEDRDHGPRLGRLRRALGEQVERGLLERRLGGSRAERILL